MVVEDPILGYGCAKDDVTPSLFCHIGNCPVSNYSSPSSHFCRVKSSLINIFKSMLGFFSIHLQDSLKHSKRQVGTVQYLFHHHFSCKKGLHSAQYHIVLRWTTYLRILITERFHSLWFLLNLTQYRCFVCTCVLLLLLLVGGGCLHAVRETWWVFLKMSWSLITL